MTAPKGFLASGVAAGIKYSRRKDVALIYSVHPATVAGLFTTNYVKAAPVLYDQKIARKGIAQAIVINSGCANACTGDGGYRDVVEMARLAGRQLNILPDRVFICSTGAIGKRLPMGKIQRGIAEAVVRLSPSGSRSAAEAILTTDKVPKEVSVKFRVGSQTVRIGAMAKGSGMIHPHMATMLAFVTTDADISRAYLQKTLRAAVDQSFHRITVDNDQSTNDTVLMLANGESGVTIRPGMRGAHAFEEALSVVCVALAKMIARDGEGATKLIQVQVTGAKNTSDAVRIAKRIAGSDLVKTAIHGNDPNVGRILAAAGSACAQVCPEKLRLHVGPVLLAQNGEIRWGYEKAARREIQKESVNIHIDVGMGTASATAWGCDLSAEYVKINAEYRT